MPNLARSVFPRGVPLSSSLTREPIQYLSLPRESAPLLCTARSRSHRSKKVPSVCAPSNETNYLYLPALCALDTAGFETKTAGTNAHLHRVCIGNTNLFRTGQPRRVLSLGVQIRLLLAMQQNYRHRDPPPSQDRGPLCTTSRASLPELGVRTEASVKHGSWEENCQDVLRATLGPVEAIVQSARPLAHERPQARPDGFILNSHRSPRLATDMPHKTTRGTSW